MESAEVEAMVLRLGGDSREFTKMISESDKQIAALAEKVVAAGNKIEGISKSIKGFGKSALDTFLGMKAISWVKGGIDSVVEGEQKMIRLKSAIESSGQDVASTVKKYDEFAKGIADVTTQGKMSVLGLLQQANAMGITGDKAMWAAKAAIGMADAFGSSAEGQLRMMAMLAEGVMPPRLEKTFPILKSIADESEKVAKAQELVAAKFKTSIDLANSTGGQMKKLEMDYKGLRKEFSALLAEALKPIISIQRDVVNWFKGMSKEAKTAVAVAAGLAIAFVSISGAIALAGTIFNTYFGGIGIVIGLVVTLLTGVAISMGGIGGTMEKLKSAAERAWAWLLPVRQSIEALWDSIKVLGAEAWEFIKEVAVNTWEFITGSVSISWDKIRDYTADAIYIMAYSLSHFKEVGALAFMWVKLKAIEFYETIFKSSGPAAYLLNAIFEPFVDAKKSAMDEFNAAFEKTASSFAEYKSKFLTATAADKKKGEELGELVGKGLVQGASDQLKNFDALLAGSFAAMDRYIDFRNKLEGKSGPSNGETATKPAMVVGGGAIAPVAPSGGGSTGGSIGDNATGLLSQIRDLLQTLVNKPAIAVQGAKL